MTPSGTLVVRAYTYTSSGVTSSYGMFGSGPGSGSYASASLASATSLTRFTGAFSLASILAVGSRCQNGIAEWIVTAARSPPPPRP